MTHVRKCAHCGAPSLRPVSRQMLIYHSVVHHKCDACGTEVEMTPIASIGVITSVGVLAILFWGVILFSDKSRPAVMATVLFGLAILAFLFVIIVPLLKHLQNPTIKNTAPVVRMTTEPVTHFAGRLIIWLEGLGFIAGLVAPLIVIVSVLAVATLIGFINFTYFGN